MPGATNPMAAMREYADAFNNGDVAAMAALCENPMQILDGLPPHVWQGATAIEDWYRDVIAEGEHAGASGYSVALGDPLHVDIRDKSAYVVVPATMTYSLHGQQATQTGAVYTVALRQQGAEWRLTAWAWAKGTG